MYAVFANQAWDPKFFVGFAIIAVITFVSVSFYIKKKEQNDIRLLDEVEDQNTILVSKNVKKFKSVLSSGYSHNHPARVSFKIFKLAVAEWKDNLSVWGLYAKLVGIYPEQNTQLEFIVQSVSNIKTKNTILKNVILSSTGYIIKTRETKFTSQLKIKISKLGKLFNKTKARIRNIWDLTLQGNTNEMNTAIKYSQESVNECEIEMMHLKQQYPNNKYVARQYVRFLSEIKGDQIAAKQAYEDLIKLSRGLQITVDTIHELGMMAYPNLPDVCHNIELPSQLKLTELESLGNDDAIIDDNTNYEELETAQSPSNRFHDLVNNYLLFVVSFNSFDFSCHWFRMVPN